MKYTLFLLLSTLTLNLSSQDSEMLNLVNTYRKLNGSTKLLWSDTLAKTSKGQVQVILKENAVSHSNTMTEIATMGISLPPVKKEMDSFIIFLKENLKVTYKEPKTEKEILTLFKQYIIYQFHSSDTHKAILLGDYKYIGFHVELSKIIYNPNYILINGRVITLNNMIGHYQGDYCAVINFRM